MGRLLKASCTNCGYESGLLRVGTGRRTTTTYFGVPALCSAERAVVVFNLKAPRPQPTAALALGDPDQAAPEVPVPELAETNPRAAVMDRIRQEMLQVVEAELAEDGIAEWSAQEEARLSYEAGEPLGFTPADLDSDGETVEPRAEWPADRGADPGPAVADDTPGEMTHDEWFPADAHGDPGIWRGAEREKPTQEIPRGPWTMAQKKAEQEKEAQGKAERTVPTEFRTRSGLIATPVEPRKTLPLMADSPSRAETLSMQLTGVASANSAIAYPCPNDGTATTLYEIENEDLQKPQPCPHCGHAALTFTVEGRWD